MPSYVYKVHDQSGRKVQGITEAISEKALADQLVKQGYLVASIKRSKASPVAMSFGNRVSPDDVILFYVQLSNMLEAGLPMLSALQTIVHQVENQSFKETVKNLIARIENGESLSEASAHHEHLFPSLYRAMMKVGEAGGNLSQVLRYVAQLEEAKSELNHKISSALAYPIVLMLASVAVVAFMMVWVVPSFITIFSKSGVSLPLPTQMVYNLSLWMRQFGFWILAFFAVFAALFPVFMRIEFFRRAWDSFWLSFPLVGLLIKRIEISRWSRSVALMISSGVNILQTLEISQNLTSNSIFQDIFKKTYESVQGGGKLADTLQKSSAVPNDVVQMVATGEHSGSLDKMLHKIASFYDELIARSLKKLTDSLEPFFVLFMGVIVGFIMLSILLPIFDMIKIFSPQ